MSKLIVEMAMPKNCGECRFCDGALDKYVCIARYCRGLSIRSMNVTRPDWCPIVGVLPDEHGDLIDRDKPLKDIQLWKSTATDTITMCFLYHIEKLLMSIRPIIAAERKDDEQIH